MSADEIRTLLTAAAIAISLASLYFSRRSWLQSNRPIVSAFLADEITGELASVYSLVVSNTGTRPAVEIRLRATAKDLAGLVRGDGALEALPGVASSFSESSVISMLRNGEDLSTSFGIINADQELPSLQYNARADVVITYRDLEGRAYSSRVPIIVRARHGFGGGKWRNGN